MSQARFLLYQNYRLKECDTLFKIEHQINKNYTKIIKEDSFAINELKLVQKNNTEIIDSKGMEINILNAQIRQDNKEIKKQKVYKWLAIIGGTALSVVVVTGHLAIH